MIAVKLHDNTRVSESNPSSSSLQEPERTILRKELLVQDTENGNYHRQLQTASATILESLSEWDEPALIRGEYHALAWLVDRREH